jgi:hypothetical protein
MISNKAYFIFAQILLFLKPKIIILFATLIQFPMIFFNLSEADSFRFAQTTLVVKQFMLNGFDPRTPLPIFGTNSYVPFEFPIFQGVAALIGSILQTSPLIATRLTALIFFQISAVIILLLTKSYVFYRCLNLCA